jgi:Asp-tRNA(Asn)/Glu-tRNA(Gln) amidotransferase C subunit
MPRLEEVIFDDLEPIEVPYRIDGTLYVLREASGDAAVKYRNACMRAARFSEGKIAGIEGAADAEPLLVSLCLYKADKDGNVPVDRQGNADPRWLVPAQTIKRWPQRVQKALFAKVKAISRLEEDDTETEESLLRQQAEIDAKLTKIQASRTNGHAEGVEPTANRLPGDETGPEDEVPEKNSSPSTEGGSASPTAKGNPSML